jgi:hypothetical protein
VPVAAAGRGRAVRPGNPAWRSDPAARIRRGGPVCRSPMNSGLELSQAPRRTRLLPWCGGNGTGAAVVTPAPHAFGSSMNGGGSRPCPTIYSRPAWPRRRHRVWTRQLTPRRCSSINAPSVSSRRPGKGRSRGEGGRAHPPAICPPCSGVCLLKWRVSHAGCDQDAIPTNAARRGSEASSCCSPMNALRPGLASCARAACPGHGAFALERSRIARAGAIPPTTLDPSGERACRPRCHDSLRERPRP